MAEIDVRARASAIRSAKARVEFFSFFFILFGGLESLDQMASVPGLPPATQELLDLLGASSDRFGGGVLFSWGITNVSTLFVEVFGFGLWWRGLEVNHYSKRPCVEGF